MFTNTDLRQADDVVLILAAYKHLQYYSYSPIIYKFGETQLMRVNRSQAAPPQHLQPRNTVPTEMLPGSNAYLGRLKPASARMEKWIVGIVTYGKTVYAVWKWSNKLKLVKYSIVTCNRSLVVDGVVTWIYHESSACRCMYPNYGARPSIWSCWEFPGLPAWLASLNTGWMFNIVMECHRTNEHSIT